MLKKMLLLTLIAVLAGCGKSSEDVPRAVGGADEPRLKATRHGGFNAAAPTEGEK